MKLRLLLTVFSLALVAHAVAQTPEATPKKVTQQYAMAADGTSLKWDLFLPGTGQGPWPVVIVIHAGGFRTGVRGPQNICLDLAAAGFAAAAKEAAPEAADPVLEARMTRITSELRCLVCQNQTLADSNADLASDLRREVREQALAGKNDIEIRDYLVARYGDFVLYDPPLKRTTWLLWFGPFVLLAGGGLLWWQVLKRRQRGPATAPTRDPAADARARALLDEPPA